MEVKTSFKTPEPQRQQSEDALPKGALPSKGFGVCTFGHTTLRPPRRSQNVQIHRAAGLRSDYDSAAFTVPVGINEKTFPASFSEL